MSEGDEYLRMYPRLEKWVHRCVGCQHRGYKPELPAHIPPGGAAKNIRSLFDELSLNGDGLCQQCARNVGRGNAGA
ncbi:MAG: hypothetical protein AAB074_15225 [Planctomycetota bacterium]